MRDPVQEVVELALRDEHGGSFHGEAVAEVDLLHHAQLRMEGALLGVELLKGEVYPGEALEADVDTVDRALDLHIALTPSYLSVSVDLAEGVVQLLAVLAPVRRHGNCLTLDRARRWRVVSGLCWGRNEQMGAIARFWHDAPRVSRAGAGAAPAALHKDSSW